MKGLRWSPTVLLLTRNDQPSATSAAYIVVIFSILVQGLTVQPLIKRYYPNGAASGADPGHH